MGSHSTPKMKVPGNLADRFSQPPAISVEDKAQQATRMSLGCSHRDLDLGPGGCLGRKPR